MSMIDPAIAGLPKSVSLLEFSAAFGLDRTQALRVLDGHIQDNCRVRVADGVQALRDAGHSPESLRAEINISNPMAATALLMVEQERRRLGYGEIQARSGPCASVVRYWLHGKAAPTLGRFVAYADALGFDVILIKTPATGKAEDEINLSDQRAGVDRLFQSRTRLGFTVMDLEAKSGVSAKSIYAWKGGQRQPALNNLVALAQVLGFEIVLRRRAA